MKKIIIIPTAKLIPESMRNYGDIPTVLYPLNSTPMVDIFRNKYSSSDIWLSTYEGSELVEEYVKNKMIDIHIHKIPELKDIAFTVANTLKLILKENAEFELAINFADTLVDEGNFSSNEIVYVKHNRIDPKWTYLKHNNGVITDIIDKQKGVIPDDYLLFVGVITIAHPEYFYDCLVRKTTSNTRQFFQAIKEYSEKYPFTFVETKKWLDIGHPDDYYNSEISVKARSFNHIKIDENRGVLTKTSDDVKKFIGEIKWYLKLPTGLEYVSPRIFDYSTDKDKPFVSMEYYSYNTIHDLFLYGNISESNWRNIFKKIKFILDDFAKYSVENEQLKESVKDMYIDKTIARLNDVKKNEKFALFFTDSITINGVKYLNLEKIIEKLNILINEKLLNIKSFCIIHGDLCFANMMIDDKLKVIKLIDPRGKFGKFDIYGDQRYELAKLFHSVDGKYDYIIKDLFDIEVNGTNIEYKVKSKDTTGIYNVMVEELSDLIGDKKEEIEIIESLLFLSMIPLHTENINHQYAMLATGIQILDRWLDIKEK